MTTQTKSVLTSLFQQGDVPQGTDYASMIDSSVNVAETSVQAMQGPLNPTELITPRVSATNINVTGALSVAGFFSAANASFGNVSFVAVSASSVNADAIKTINVSADGTIYASAMRANFFIGLTGIISAAGTAQGTAAILTNTVNRGRGVTDGSTTGFAPPANNAGLVQYLYNEGASANLWPPIGGTINGLAVNTAFPLAASAMVTIVHLTASAMAAK